MNILKEITEEIKKVVKGKDEVSAKILMAIAAGGHVLLEDMPGVGKTTLALCFAKAMDLDYKRIQFTPDVLASDIMGYFMYNVKTQEFEFKDGMAMCNLLLADEINRTSPRTQSALLEVMEEGKVTVDAITKELPKPFFVIATQNPFGSFGTQRMPQSQLDRFIIRLSMGYPDEKSEIEILKGARGNKTDIISKITDKKGILKIQEECSGVFVDDSLYDYIVSLANETRNSQYLSGGLSPRGSIALLKMSKANAFYNGRDYIIPEDITDVLYDVCGHRIELSTKAKGEGLNEKDVLEMLRKKIKMPKVKR